jgi:flagellar hook capping protein FlgD
MPRFLLSSAIAVAFFGIAGLPSPAFCKPVHGVLWYGPALNDSVRTLTAQRYSVGVTGKNEKNDFEKVQIKSKNPRFQWYVYNSGTDNYVPPNADLQEYDALQSFALQKGWDPEIAYLHYWDDTRLVLEGDTLFLPGWGGGASTDPAQSRIPVYYKNLTRRVCNFSTPQAAELYRRIMVGLAFDTPFSGSSVYPDGLFLDNSAPVLFNFGTVLSGGHVRETPVHALMGSAEFRSWWWDQNLAPYLTSLRDTLQTASTWSKDHNPKYLMINVSNVWDDSYGSRGVADVLGMEFQYNPVRNFGLSAVDQSYQHDVLAAASGINSFYLSTNTRTVSGHVGSYTLPEIMFGNLCWFLLSRTPDSIFYQQGTNSPTTVAWDSLTWIGAMDVADKSLGEAVGPPYTLAQGTDPMGHPYAVHAREYQTGFVVLRNRGDWTEGIETETAVSVSLPHLLQPVATDGTLGPLVNNVTLRNGQGALFLYNPTPVTLLSFTVTRETGGARIEWELAGGADDLAGFDVYREIANGERVKLNGALLPPKEHSLFLDGEPPAVETHYWLADLSRTGTTNWHGPVTLAASTVSKIHLQLSQNTPNPVRAGGSTRIQFRVGREGPVVLQVFDVTGHEVRRLVDEALPAGEHQAIWDGSNARAEPVRAGLYFYRLVTADGSKTRKLLLVP